MEGTVKADAVSLGLTEVRGEGALAAALLEGAEEEVPSGGWESAEVWTKYYKSDAEQRSAVLALWLICC